MIGTIADLDACIRYQVELEHDIKVGIQWQYERGEVILIVGNCADEVSEAVKQTIIETVRQFFPLTIRQVSTVPF